MFNVFGDLRSTGPRGPPGYSSFNLVKWAPDAVKKMYRDMEMINIYFDTKEGSVIKVDKKPVAIKNFGKGNRAECVQNFPSIVQIKHDKWMMEMRDSLFHIAPIKTATISDSTAIFSMSFKALSESPDIKTRFLFSNHNQTRGISVKDKQEGIGVLTIHSSGTQAEITFDRDEWAGILLQYTCIDKVIKCQYLFNDQVGELDVVNGEDQEDTRLYLGGHPSGGTCYHAVGSFELYYKHLKKGESGLLPEEMGKCLLRDILDRVDKEDE